MDKIKWLIDVVLHLDRHLAEMSNALVEMYGSMSRCSSWFFVQPGLSSLHFFLATHCYLQSGRWSQSRRLTSFSTHVCVVADRSNFRRCCQLLDWSCNGARVFTSETSRLLNKQHLEKAQAFYQKYGGKAIFLARLPSNRSNIRTVCRGHRQDGSSSFLDV